MKRFLFIGGPGNLSEHAINLIFKDSNHKVILFTLPESPVHGLSGDIQIIRGNRDRKEELLKVIDEKRPDVIIDTVCFLPEQARTVAEAAKGKTGHFVFISTCDVYGYPLSRLPMRENDPWVKTNSTYAENKRLCELVFQEYEKNGQLPLTIIRPSYSFGNNFVISFFSRDGGKYLIPHLRAGKPVFVPGDGTTLMHASVAVNTGRMIGTIACSEKTIRKCYTCGHESFITHDQYVGLFAKALGVDPVIVHIPYDLLLKTGRKEIRESILEDVTRHNIAFSLDAFKADFPDFRWVKSLEESASDYIRYNDQHGSFAPTDEEIFEDKLIVAWKELANNFEKSF